MNLELQEKVVLLTGGAKGIGEAILRGFLAENAKVAYVDRSIAEGESIAAEFETAGKECLFIPGDLCDPAVCERAVGHTLERFGRIDVLVNNAGVNDGVGLAAGPTQFAESLERNLLHYYALTHYALDSLKRHRGCVVNIGSKVSVTGQGNTSGYAAAKGAINGLTREWAVELAADGVRVNAVLPAETWTPLYESWLKTMPDPANARSRIEQQIPLGRRFTTTREIADTVIFLASPRSSHTTGQIVFVDGGFTHLRMCDFS